MKTLLTHITEQSGSEYDLWAETTPCMNPKGYTSLRIFSTYSGARDPSIARERVNLLLSPEARKQLKDLLT
jgi:hypothetical protein